ncbi:MAG: AAA family ATPase [Clostridiales bacterium]|nr:AAA family ATPase [Clostridiales bacterium]
MRKKTKQPGLGSPRPAGAPRLIGLTGTNGAGKGEVAAYLSRKGYAYFSLSDEIREELRKKGKEITRDSLIAMGNSLRRRYGPDILARRVAKKAKGKAVIDSIRNLSEAAYLRGRGGFVLVAVDAPAELRYKRVRRRGRLESAATLEEFMAKEKKEMAGGKAEQQLSRVMATADFAITNDGTLASLRRKVEALL